jgi:hypothetical protein
MAARNIDRAVEVFLELILCPGVERWSYLANQEPVQFILSEGLHKGSAATVRRVGEAVNYFASLGVDFLDLEPLPPSVQ